MNFSLISFKIENSKPMDFGDILSKSFDLFQKVWVQGFLMVLVMFVVMMAVVGIIVFPLTIFTNGEFIDLENTSKVIEGIILIVSMIMLFFVIFAIMIGFTAGFFTVCKEKDLGENSGSGDLFRFFSRKYILKTYILGTIYFGIMIVGYALCFFPLLYLSVPLSYLIVIYAFNPELSVSEIVKLSFKIGNKNWIMTFLLTLVAGMIAQMGVFLCGVGILFTVAYTYVPMYLSYKAFVGFEKEDEIDEIGQTEEWIND